MVDIAADSTRVLPSGSMRLLVITARYPTEDRPAAGVFVRDRLADPGLRATVVAPRSYAGSRLAAVSGACAGRHGPRGVDSTGWKATSCSPPGRWRSSPLAFAGVPFVVVAHGGDVRDSAHRSRLHGWLARRVLRGADRVVANSSETAERIHRFGVEAEVVPPGVDLARFTATPRPSGPRRVLYLGGDVPHKGVEVARQLADTLVGPGLREVDPAEVPALMAAHDVVLVPSLEEPYGVVAAEAIASRTLGRRPSSGRPDRHRQRWRERDPGNGCGLRRRPGPRPGLRPSGGRRDRGAVFTSEHMGPHVRPLGGRAGGPATARARRCGLVENDSGGLGDPVARPDPVRDQDVRGAIDHGPAGRGGARRGGQGVRLGRGGATGRVHQVAGMGT